MSDLISRQAVIDRINKLIEVEKKQGTDDWGYGRERVNAYEAMLYFVKSEYLYPSVDSSIGSSTTDIGSPIDCISRQAAIDAIWKPIIKPNEMIFDALKQAQQNEIEKLPSVEPERKPGKWIRAIDPDVNAWTGGHTCSECGRACVQMSMNYCANCGAPMEVET